MAINKKRDFKKLSVRIQEFLSRLPCDESTGFLRDTLYLSLLELHRYYIKEKDRLNSSLTQSKGTLQAAGLNQRFALDKYECRWQTYEGSEGTKNEGFLAAFQGDIAKLKETVQSDDLDVLGQTYLMYAVQGMSEQQQECFDFLFSLKFNINQQANDGCTALHLACWQNKKNPVILLLKQKADITMQDEKGRAALHWAAINPTNDITKLLLQHGADINVKDCDGMTPVMWACHFNNLANLHVLKHALERVDPRCEALFEDRDGNGDTVLHWAVAMRDAGVECLKDILISDISYIRNNQGRTILHSAAKEGSISACELILSVCGKEILHIRDNENQTALHLATLCGHGEIIDYLLHHGANTFDENSSGRTALQEAEFGHYHYCLLVFAAFEQMKLNVEKNTELIQTLNDTETRKYESWVIPTGFLNDSQEISKTPTTDNGVLPERQSVDVTEIKGFEVNGDTVTSPQKVSENINTKNSHSVPLQSSKKIEQKHKEQSIPVYNKLNQENVSSQENITVLGDNEQLKELLEYSSQDLQHDSVSSLVSNNSVEVEENSISENIEVSSLEETNEEHSKSEMDMDHSEKDGHEENHNFKEDEKAQEQRDALITTKNEEASLQNSRGHGVTALNPLKQSSFSIPSKLDPIPSPYTSPKSLDKLAKSGQSMQPRGIVAPLQPVLQKEPLRPLLREKRPQSDTSTAYGTRGPEHGPLAYSHGKALLNNVFQPDIPKKKPDLQSQEPQRRPLSNKPGKLPHPPKHN